MRKSRVEFLEVSPEELVIVGLDTSDGPEHPRYDPRAALPVSEGLASSIERSWFGSVACVRTPRGLELVFGRQRTKAGRLVNERRRLRGGAPVEMIAQVVPPGDEKLLSDVTIQENECRQDDDSLTKAYKVEAYLRGNKETGPRTKAEAAVAFGCAEATLDGRLKLLTLTEPVREAVGAGVISQATALALADLTPEAQARAVRLKALAKAKGTKAELLPGETPNGSTKPKKRHVMAVAKALGGDVQLALAWAVGDITEAAASEAPKLAAALLACRSKR